MFDRKKYKSFARIQLKKRRTVPVLMTLVTALIVLLLSLPSIKTSIAIYTEILQAALASTNQDEILRIIQKYRKTAPLESFLSWIVFFVTAICTIAQYCVYLKMSRSPEPVSFGDFFTGFAHWLRAIGAALWRRLWTYLWTLVFFIPGIVKAIAYSQTDYIVAEFPHVPVTQALDISKKITRGYKADLFVLHLSFFGWYLLCVLTFGVASLWVVPYQMMTYINVYHALMKRALETGVVTLEDIGDSNGERYGKQ